MFQQNPLNMASGRSNMMFSPGAPLGGPGAVPPSGGFIPYQQGPAAGLPPTGGGGGIDWAKILMGGGMLAGAGADIYSAYKEGKVNEANFAAQMAQQQMINGLVGQYMTPAGQANPFSSAIMNFLGQSAGGATGQQPRSGIFGSGVQRLGGGGIRSPGPASDVPRARSQTGTGGMYQYDQKTPAASYDPSMLGAAPIVSAPQQQIGAGFNPMMVNAPQQQALSPFGGAQAGNVTPYNPQMLAQLQGGQAVQVNQAPQIQMPGGINLPSVGSPQGVMPQMVTGTQGNNAGQDALLQMMRRDVGAPRDASIDPMLQSGTASFDNSGLMNALKTQDQGLLDEQVNALRGSAGSFGERFGSDMRRREMDMRTQFATNVAARNAGLQAQSFEQAAGRNLQGAGLQAGREQFFGQMPLQNAQLQLGAAQAAQQGGFQQQGTDLQAQLANQQAGLQAQQFNVNANQGAQQFNAQNAINASLATQGLQAQVGQANASNSLQALLANQQSQNQMTQFNQGNSLQAMLANQSTGMQAGLANNQLAAQLGMFNAGNQQQAGMQNQQLSQLLGSQNQQAGLQALLSNQNAGLQSGMQNQQLNQLTGSQNQQSMLQALLANQSMQGQYATANQQAGNQAGQFNASMLQNQNQFGAQQGNIYNQLMMSGMMNAAGLQQQQFGNNAQMLGILAGLGIPQQQVNPMYGAIGDAATTAGMMPMLWQMMQGGR